ncbi:MAG TPA: tetratricopeptide repeat protein, partial [Phycisphaerae bacterium]|nr:tetratricopeptide repeat protein [Phycisphaerae bacterium]
MYCSSFTADVDRRPAAAPLRTDQGPGRWTTAVTFILLGTWLAIISFGAISLCQPVWLKRAGQTGVDEEFRAATKYGDASMRQRQYNLALGSYAKALQLKPKEPRVMTNMAVAYVKLGELQNAAGVLNELTQMDLRPGLRSTVFANLSLVAEQQKKIDEAIIYCQKAREGAVEPEKLHRRLGGLYLATGRFAEARTILEQAAAEQQDPTCLYRKMLVGVVD